MFRGLKQANIDWQLPRTRPIKQEKEPCLEIVTEVKIYLMQKLLLVTLQNNNVNDNIITNL